MRTQSINTGGSNALPVGYQLGEYSVVAVLGEGGFGITYRARDTKLGVDVAIKEYFPSMYAARSESSTIVPRVGTDLENYRWGLSEFLKEAQALAKFKHPHIVRVLRFLEANGTAYTIMEYEEGETLNAYLRKHGGVLAEPTLLQIFLPILNGLQAVHDAGLLHLDIKPDNIYLRQNEQPILIDFGSSRQMRGDAGGKITLTPGYCALEQYPGHGAISAASDVYGMGATLYRCITGKSPVDARQRYTGFDRTRIDPLPPASSFERPSYSPHIRECVDRALKLVADERPASAYALQQGLMGKDMTKLSARSPTALLYRPGTGYIGAVLPAEKEKKLLGRRHSFLEKTVAITVFLATFAIITPKMLIDTDHMTIADLYQWIDDTKSDITARTREFGEQINEQVFGVKPRPKVPQTATLPRPRPVEQAPATAEAPPKSPFGSDKQRVIDLSVPDRRPLVAGFLKHGATLAVANDDGLVQLWDIATGTVRATLPTRVLTPAALGVFPSSQWLAAMDRNQSITIFDPLGNPETVLTAESPHPIVALTVSTEGRLLAEAAEDGTVTLWELSQKRRLHTLASGKHGARALLFTPDERLLLAGDAGGGITLWTNADGKLISHRQAHERGVAAAAFSPDGRRLASADNKGDVKLWTVPAPGEEWTAGRAFLEGPSTISALAFSPDGEWLLATGSGSSIYVWNVESGALAHQLATDRPNVQALALTRDGKWLAAIGDDRVVRVWK
jgi:serine/threonine protein kinase